LSGALAVFDLDGTITRHDTFGPYLWGYLRRHPWRLIRLVPAIAAPIRYLLWRDRGALKGAALRAVAGGARRDQLDQWSDQFVRQLLPHGLFAEALAAIAEHRKRGDRLLLMSASVDLYVPRIAQALGFDEVICTQVRWLADGRRDGRLASANRRGEEKRRCLAEVIERDQPERVYAYGNAGSDFAHMALAHQDYMVNGPAAPTQFSSTSVHALRWQQRAHLH
jgi:phosphatidylglycerophosphatase C